jgi:flavin-dependent dehydrogenase
MDQRADVAVVGGGLAGLATSVHLRRHGRSVICLEPKQWPRQIVGESLDFSAVALLEELGISKSSLLAAPGGFDKTAIEIIAPHAESASLWPPNWFARPPIWCSMNALHVDRAVLDHWIAQSAIREGVRVLEDRAANISVDGDAIKEIQTKSGRQIRARWFIDATGRSVRLFGRRFKLTRQVLGPAKVSQWTRFRIPPKDCATTFYIQHPQSDYLEWVWEIPLSPSEVSVGCVLTTDAVKRLRRDDLDNRQVFESRLRAFKRLEAMVSAQPDYELHTTSFTPSCYQRPIGANWLIVGDAAAIADPLTSNGVTASLRHAKLAASLVHDSIGDAPTRTHQWVYRQSTEGMVKALDKGIENLVYGPSIRRWLGVRAAIILYAFFGIITNSIYSRLRPITLPRTIVLLAILVAGRTWISMWGTIGHRLRTLRT